MSERLVPEGNRPLTPFEQSVEKATGLSIEMLRNTPIDRMRKLVEAIKGRAMIVSSHWPLIGRKSPPNLISRAELDKKIDELLK